MSTTTTNYGLSKPTSEEYYNVEISNANMDKIDTAMKNLDNNKEVVLKNAAEKTSLADTDSLPLLDSTDSSKTKKLSFANFKILLKTIFATKEEVSALNGSLSEKEGLIKDASAKTTLADADTISLSDSAASNTTKKITFANLKTLLASIFLPITGGTITGKIQVNNISGRQVAIFQWADVSQCGGGLAMFANNAYLDHSDNTYKYSSTHATLGARGIVFKPGTPSPLWFDTGSVVATANSTFTPTLYKLYGEYNITVSTTAPSFTLAEGAQHQVY